MLLAAMLVLGLAVLFGLWLAGLYLLEEKPPQGLGWRQWAHATAGAAGVAVTLLALRAPDRAGHATGGFGWTGFWLLAGALAGGLLILTQHLRGRGAPGLLVAMHGSIAVAGYIILAAYYSAPVSYGR